MVWFFLGKIWAETDLIFLKSYVYFQHFLNLSITAQLIILVYVVYNEIYSGIFLKVGFIIYDNWNKVEIFYFLDFNILGFL